MKTVFIVWIYTLLGLSAYAQIGSRSTPLYCANSELLDLELRTNPYEQERINTRESAIQNGIGTFDPQGGFSATIPVVVHIVSNPSNSATNISDQQVIDQIAALNNEFNVVNGTNIFFCLAQNLPDQSTNWTSVNGTGTAGITRTSDAEISDHNVAYEQGMLNSLAVGFDPQRYLNIWVVENITGFVANILGYSPSPIVPSSILDGIVIRFDVFGDDRACSSCYSLLPPYQEGKILVHEAGHYLGIYHPFQLGVFGNETTCLNTTCATNGDLCCDTPPCWCKLPLFQTG
jgi:hypothetical protein